MTIVGLRLGVIFVVVVVGVGSKNKTGVGVTIFYDNATVQDVFAYYNLTRSVAEYDVFFPTLFRQTDYFLTSYNLRSVDELKVRQVTGEALKALSDSHILLAVGGRDLLIKLGSVALFQALPVISLIPLHNWYNDGKRLTNVIIPRLGQRFKGLALVDLLKPHDGVKTEVSLIFREEIPSPELLLFRKEKEKTVGLLTYEFGVSNESLRGLRRALQPIRGSNDFRFDSVVFDCSLRYVDTILSIIEDLLLVKNLVVVFMHDFIEVLHWFAGSTKHHRLPDYTFAFQLVVPRAENRTNEYSVLSQEIASILADAAVKIDFDPENRTPATVPLINDQGVACDPSFRTLYFNILKEADELLDALTSVCESKGAIGGVTLTKGGDLPTAAKKCTEFSNISFNILKLTRTSENRWIKYGQWSKAERRSFGAWKLNPYADTLTRTSVLQVSVYSNPPFTYWNDSAAKWEGVDIDLLDAIQTNLTTTRFVLSRFNESVPLGYQNRTQHAVDHLTEDGTTLAVGGLTIEERYRNFFGRSYFTIGVGFATLNAPRDEKESDDNNMWNFMSPFHWTVWLVLICLIVFSSVVCKWLGVVTGYKDGLWISCCALFFMQENALVRMKSPFARIYVSTLCFFFLVLVSSYTANMVSFLTSENVALPKSFVDLKDSQVTSIAPSHLVDRLKSSAGIKTISSVSDESTALRLLRTGKATAYIAEKHRLDRLVLYPNCDLIVSNDVIYKQQLSFIHKELKWILLGEINAATTSFVVNGRAEESYRRFLSYGTPKGTCGQSHGAEGGGSGDEEESLTFYNLGGVYIIIACIAAISVIANIIWRAKLKRRRKIVPGPRLSLSVGETSLPQESE